MNTAEFDRMFAIEETHWWYRGRRELVRTALERHAPARRPLQVLDVACATGMSFRFLSDIGQIRGIDISDETIRYCAMRGIDRIVKADAMALPFAAGSYDVVLALDAFEHFDDDLAAMRETWRVLRPGGVLVATVPAFMSLWSPHDDAYHHKRRYRRPQFRERLERAGFAVERVSYTTMTLFVPVFLLRRWRRLREGGANGAAAPSARPHGGKEEVSMVSDFAVPFPRPVELLASAITSAEIALERRIDLPFGVSLLAVMRKPG
ncbi:MAG TPA: class I SAM-dependent methyltransferase [Planctomycetota bacterium]|nr:class I SAM-dependent methyltransferase [Planctomycetota bacterium]